VSSSLTNLAIVIAMPLPNYGYYNKEEKKHQDLVFQMAPQMVDVPVKSDDTSFAFGTTQKETQSRKKGRVTTGIP
jgi:hypothetical protein